MRNVDGTGHVTGRSIYLDDIPVQQGTLYALPYDAPSAHAHIKKLDLSKAAAYPVLCASSPTRTSPARTDRRHHPG